MKLYYMIWVDALLYQKSIPANREIWKFMATVGITLGMFIDLITIIAILERNFINLGIWNIHLNISPWPKINILITSFTFFFLPPLLLNYILIFRNKKYEKLFELYPYNNGKLCKKYILISYSFPFVLFFLAFIWLKVLGME